MIQRLKIFHIATTNPYENLALEAYFLKTCPADTCILYLWQNRHTVVIGKNQNAWQECNVSLLQQDGGCLARRPSGGGAVFHDLGNLNFTFVTGQENYNIDRQLSVICRAVKKFGLDAQKTGRNDITIDGRKFSGNAFQKAHGNGCHHGTLLVDVDTAQMAKYLNVSPKKLQSKGVSSVKSRVVNLSALSSAITVPSLSRKLVEAFEEVYGLRTEKIDRQSIDWAQVHALSETFSSWDWLFGREIPFSFQLEDRFSWGGMQILLEIQSGTVASIRIYSDAMDIDFIDLLAEKLTGLPFVFSAFAEALAPFAQISEYAAMVSDLQNLFLAQQS